jgi:hypothetical protein
MQINDETFLAEMGGSIREIYTGGEPFADHLGDGIRVSTITYLLLSVMNVSLVW